MKALIFTSKEVDEATTTIVVSGKDRRGHLLAVVKLLEERGITIVKAVISSKNNSVNDTFTIKMEDRGLTADELTAVCAQRFE